MSFTILSALDWWARETPEILAVDVGGKRLTYRDLRDRAATAAARLSFHEVRRGDRIGVLADPSASFCVLALAAQMVGAIVVPLNVRQTAPELRTALEDTTPRLLFADAARLELARQASAGSTLVPVPLDGVEKWTEAAPQFRPYDAARSDLVAIVSTSGSTAKPKFVMFSHEMVVSVASELAVMEPSCRHGAKVLVLSPFFSGGLYVWFEYLVLGCSQFLQPHFDAKQALALLENERINVMPATPIHWERISQQPGFEAADLSSLQWTTIGGSRVPQALLDRYRAKGVILRPLFGQTEAGGAWAARGEALKNPRQSGYGGIFTEFRIAGEGNQHAPPGQEGEILIRGPSTTVGYWNNPEITQQTLQNGWLRTGDLGIVDAIGSLTFVDRIKDIVISGGLNISSAEIEHVIGAIPGVIEVAIIAAEDPKFGETPLAVVHGDGSVRPEQVVEHCNRHLADYKVPRYVVLEPEPLPRLASGKISKPQLRERHARTAASLPRLR